VRSVSKQYTTLVLDLQLLLQLAAVLGISMISASATADDDIKASLPGMEEPPPTFDACVEHGAYDVLCLTAQERAVTLTCHCVQLLHVPGEHAYQQYALMQTQAKCRLHVSVQSIRGTY